MKIRIKTTINIPEIPSEIEMETGTLRDVFVKVFSGVHFADQFIDLSTGEIRVESVFEVRLNDVAYYSLPQGLDTDIRDGDTVTLSLEMLGGG